MKAGWNVKPLGEVCTLQRGFDLPTQDRKTGQFPLVSSSGISDTHDEGPILGPGVVTGRSGSIGNVFYIADSFWPLNTTLYVRDFHGNIPRFVYYLLVAFDLKKYAGGTGVPTLNRNDVHCVPVVVPSELPEQQRIVTLLDEAFDGIATSRAHAEKNLQNARAIFDSHLQSVFTQRGNGWISTTIGNSCTLKSGTTVPVSIEKPSGDVPYVKVAEMTLPDNQDGITTSIRFLNRPDVKAGWLIPAGAVIFPKRGGAILTNKKRLALVDMCADLNIMSVIPTEKLTSEFLYFYFLTVDMRKLGTGSSIPQINNYDIAPLEIAFPESTLKQVEIAESIRLLETECQALEALYQRKLTALDELKKSLLAQAFSGAL